MWVQLVIEVAREKCKRKHPCCISLCAFRCIRPEVFYYLSEKLLLSRIIKTYATSEGAISHIFILRTALLHCS